MKSMTRARLTATSLLGLVAAVGFTGGVITERLVLAGRGAAPVAGSAPAAEGVRVLIRGQQPGEAGEGQRIRFLLPGRLAEALDLSPAQQAEIERILAADQAAIRTITDEFEPALVAIVEGSRQRIYAVLTDEQIARWQALPPLRLQRGIRQPPN